MSETQLVPVSHAASLFPSAEELKTLKEMAQTFISSGLLPKAIDKPEKAIVVMLKGKEAGIPPLQALAHIHVIDGKPGMSAELMLSQLLKHIPGFSHQFTETSNAACRMKVKRPGGDWQDFSFTIQDAAAAGLTSKGPWRAYPAAMLRARCISSMARAIGPEALAGISHTPEELGAEVDASGNFVSASQSSDDKVSRLRALNQSKPEPKEVHVEVAKTVEVQITPVTPAPRVETAHPTIAPEPKPLWGDDLPSVVQAKDVYDPYGDYTFKANSSLKDIRVKDVPIPELEAFITTTKEHFKVKGMAGAVLEDVSRVEEYLRALQDAKAFDLAAGLMA